MAQNEKTVLKPTRINGLVEERNSVHPQQVAESSAQVAACRVWSFVRPAPHSAPECRQIVVVFACQQPNQRLLLSKPWDELRDGIESFKR
jgi:hypothetical protein